MLNKPIKQINPMPLFVYYFFFSEYLVEKPQKLAYEKLPSFRLKHGTSKRFFDEIVIKEIHKRGKLIRLELIEMFEQTLL